MILNTLALVVTEILARTISILKQFFYIFIYCVLATFDNTKT